MKSLQIQGMDIKVYPDKVKIYDPFDIVSDDYALQLVTYLYDEGFIEGNKDIECEIITP